MNVRLLDQTAGYWLQKHRVCLLFTGETRGSYCVIGVSRVAYFYQTYTAALYIVLLQYPLVYSFKSSFFKYIFFSTEEPAVLGEVCIFLLFNFCTVSTGSVCYTGSRRRLWWCRNVGLLVYSFPTSWLVSLWNLCCSTWVIGLISHCQGWRLYKTKCVCWCLCTGPQTRLSFLNERRINQWS